MPASTHVGAARARQVGPERVVNCYAFFDKVFPDCGMVDYTEGMYHGDPSTPYDAAQLNQVNYVLDQAECRAGSRILEIGCGNGRLLAEAQRRGARIIGLTISPEQVARCRALGVDARLLNYRDLDEPWDGRFDAVIANGPIEHFVQARDAAAGLADAIYREFFEICRRVIDPASPVQKLVNTTIHFVRPPDPNDLLKQPRELPADSAAFHFCMLEKSFGGWYPSMGQFARCAAGLWDEVCRVDGTEDYCWTSEHWLSQIQQALRSPERLPALAWRSAPTVLRHPRQCFTMLRCMLGTQSWNWQFRGGDAAPTRLLRQTWRRRASDESALAAAPSLAGGAA